MGYGPWTMGHESFPRTSDRARLKSKLVALAVKPGETSATDTSVLFSALQWLSVLNPELSPAAPEWNFMTFCSRAHRQNERNENQF